MRPPHKFIFSAGLFTAAHGFNTVGDVKPWVEVLLESKAKGLVSEFDTVCGSLPGI